eukprot:gene22584-30849_t
MIHLGLLLLLISFLQDTAALKISVLARSHIPVRGFHISNGNSFHPKNRLHMSSKAGGGGGSTKLDRKTSQQTVTKPTYKEEIEKEWRLILHDDTVHTIQQVCDIVSLCCPLCTGPRAYEVTLEVHMNGAATVAVANKKIIEEYSKSLQAAGLTVSTAPDDDFEPAEEET